MTLEGAREFDIKEAVSAIEAARAPGREGGGACPVLLMGGQ